MREHLRRRPIELSLLALLIAALAVVVIARVTEADAVGRAFKQFDPAWIALIAGAELLAYPAYMWAYRSIASFDRRAPLALPLVARIVVAGFGPFSVAGGFGLDRQALQGALHEDEESVRVRVAALGVLEWAVLAPTTCVVAITFLITGANILPSLLWPWAVLVPVGFGLALWASVSPRILQWLPRGRARTWAGHGLAGISVLRTLARSPRRYAGAWLGTALYWAADISAFYGGLRTFGLSPGPGRVILAYATGYAATRRSLPLGGAGLTEVLMTYSLYWVRLPLAPALGAVVAYRLFNLLLAAMAGVIAHRQLEPLLADGSGGKRNKHSQTHVSQRRSKVEHRGP